MIKKILCCAFAMCLLQAPFAQSKKEKAVAEAVLQLRDAMINADKVALERITDDGLTYGHSGGKIEGRDEFINNIVSGKSDFVTMDLTKQTIVVEDKTAIVRHELNANINDNNKAGTVHLLVMLVWIRDDGRWKLLGRQAVKVNPTP